MDKDETDSSERIRPPQSSRKEHEHMRGQPPPTTTPSTQQRWGWQESQSEIGGKLDGSSLKEDADAEEFDRDGTHDEEHDEHMDEGGGGEPLLIHTHMGATSASLQQKQDSSLVYDERFSSEAGAFTRHQGRRDNSRLSSRRRATSPHVFRSLGAFHEDMSSFSSDSTSRGMDGEYGRPASLYLDPVETPVVLSPRTGVRRSSSPPAQGKHFAMDDKDDLSQAGTEQTHWGQDTRAPSMPARLSLPQQTGQLGTFAEQSQPQPQRPAMLMDFSDALISSATRSIADTTTGGKRKQDISVKDAYWFLDSLEQYHVSKLSEDQRQVLVQSHLRDKPKHRNAVLFCDDHAFLFEERATSWMMGQIERLERERNGPSDSRVVLLHEACKVVLASYQLSLAHAPAKSCIWSAMMIRTASLLTRCGVSDVQIVDHVEGVQHKEATLVIQDYHISRSNFTKLCRTLLRKEEAASSFSSASTASSSSSLNL